MGGTRRAVVAAVAGMLALALLAGPAAGQRKGRPVQATVPGVQLLREQRERIVAIRRQTERQAQQVLRNPNLTQSEKDRRVGAIRDRGHERVLNVLSPQQREAFYQHWQERRAVAGYRGSRQDRGRPAR